MELCYLDQFYIPVSHVVPSVEYLNVNKEWMNVAAQVMIFVFKSKS
jgi:hypothetical protein